MSNPTNEGPKPNKVRARILTQLSSNLDSELGQLRKDPDHNKVRDSYPDSQPRLDLDSISLQRPDIKYTSDSLFNRSWFSCVEK